MFAVGVLASGSGTNLQSLLDACAEGRIPARVAVVVCNIPDARAMERARAHGVPAVLVDHRAFPDKAAFEAEIQAQLRAHGVELLVLAGFMRLLSASFVQAWEGRLLNVHPSLLPSFPGLHAIRQALAAGVRVTGCTVHLVDEGTDTGPILAQAAVPVLPEDDEASLHARVQVEEHRLLPWVVGHFAAGKVRYAEGRVALELPEAAWPRQGFSCPSPGPGAAVEDAPTREGSRP